MNNILTGYIGESLACAYLEKNGFKIVQRNYKTKFGEIDIVTQHKDKTLVFHEVKTISLQNIPPVENIESYQQVSGNLPDYLLNQFGIKVLAKIQPEEQMTKKKILKYKRICEWYTNVNNNIVNEKKGYRLDCIFIYLYNNLYSILHIKNI